MGPGLGKQSRGEHCWDGWGHWIMDYILIIVLNFLFFSFDDGNKKPLRCCLPGVKGGREEDPL